MSNFFISKEDYNERLNICRSCEFLFKPTMTCKKCGCFMRIKASIGVMSCPVKKWNSIGEYKTNKIPEHLKKEILEIWEDIKTGEAKTKESKNKMVELHNTIYNTGFRIDTNCNSCLGQCYRGIKQIIDQWEKNEGLNQDM